MEESIFLNFVALNFVLRCAQNGRNKIFEFCALNFVLLRRGGSEWKFLNFEHLVI